MGRSIIKEKAKKYTFIVLGIISLVLGIIGIVLPILPTTPFLLLSSYLFYRSSEKFHSWLINHKIFGQYIYNYKTYKAIKRRDKIITLFILYITISISFFIINSTHLRIFLVVVALAVTIHLLKMKTLENVK